MARKFGANCSKCQRSTEQQQSIKCFKIHGKDLLQNNDFHITSSIFLLSSVLVFYFFLILFFNSIVYRFFIARIFGVLPEYFRDWGGCRPPRPPGLVRLWVASKRVVSYTKFIELWKQFHPNLVVAKPMTDLCFTCQQNTSKLLRAANLPESEKSECVRTQQYHLNSVQTERELYNKACDDAKCSFKALGDSVDIDERHDPCSLDTTMHYSFDFAQQVHYPSNPMQPGPIYFKTPRKCAIFGIMCEAIPQQVNYLIDEASDVRKGANTTISYVHHFFEHHGLGETSVHLHADNCSGQNKNNYFVWYLAWRTILQLHLSVRYSFFIAGHTKFAPDRCLAS